MAEMAALARGEDPRGGARAELQVGGHLRRRVRGRDALLLLGLGAPGRARGAPRRPPSVVILGSGPNRIGQGIEFDYCCVHAAMTVRESGRDAVMINCNPETVSTDYDTSDRLYFEPLTLEDVLGVIEVERPEGVIVQFGGQTPLKLAAGLADAGVPLLGTPVESIHLRRGPARASAALLDELGLEAPPYATAESHDEALEVADRRWATRCSCGPSYVLGGRAMEICYSREQLAELPEAHERRRAAGRSSSTASSRTRSRSTWTRSATATDVGSARSCSTSRRRACTRATRPA